MRFLLILMLAIIPFATAAAAGDHVQLYNIGVTVSMEDEVTTLSLFLDGSVEPEKVATDEESIQVFNLPGVELTAADGGVTSFMVFSPSVASIKLTQINTDPFTTRLEIYTNGARDYAIQQASTGLDFLVFPVGTTPPVAEATPQEDATPEPAPAVEEAPVEEPQEEVLESGSSEAPSEETPAAEIPAAIPQPEKPPVVQPPQNTNDPLGYKPIPEGEWNAPPEAAEEAPPVKEPVVEEPVKVEPEVVAPVEPVITEPEKPATEEPVVEAPVEEPAKEPVVEENGFNLLEGINLLGGDEAVKAPETPSESTESGSSIADEMKQPAAPEETTPPVGPPPGSVKLDNVNFQAGDADTDLLVFTLAGEYPGTVRTNFSNKKGYVVLTHCDVSDFVKPGEFKTVPLSGTFLRYIVININSLGEAVFSLILSNPEAKYTMEQKIEGDKVMVYLKTAE